MHLRRLQKNAQVPQPRAHPLPARVEQVLRDAHRPRAQARAPAVGPRGAEHPRQEELRGGQVRPGLVVADQDERLDAARHEADGRVVEQVALQAVVEVVERGVEPVEALHHEVRPGRQLVGQADALVQPQREGPGPLRRRVHEQVLVREHRARQQPHDLLRRVRRHVLEHGLRGRRRPQRRQRAPQERLEPLRALVVQEPVAGRVMPEVHQLACEGGEVREEELPPLRDARRPADAAAGEGVKARAGRRAVENVLQDGVLEGLQLLARDGARRGYSAAEADDAAAGAVAVADVHARGRHGRKRGGRRGHHGGGRTQGVHP